MGYDWERLEVLVKVIQFFLLFQDTTELVSEQGFAQNKSVKAKRS